MQSNNSHAIITHSFQSGLYRELKNIHSFLQSTSTLRAICDPNCTKNPLTQCFSRRHGICIRTPLKKYFFVDYVINVLPSYRKEVVAELGTAEGKSQPPHPEPLLNTKTIFTPHRNCSERWHFSEQHAYAALIQRSHN